MVVVVAVVAVQENYYERQRSITENPPEHHTPFFADRVLFPDMLGVQQQGIPSYRETRVLQIPRRV